MNLDPESLHRLQRLALLGRLSSGVIHDFKNMLTGIQGMLQWVNTAAEPDSRVRPALLQTLTHVQEATALLNSTLAFFGSKTPRATHEVDLRPIISSTRSLISHLLPPHVQLEVSAPDDLPRITSDGPLCQDILLNLCLNAIEATRTKGDRLEISAAPCSLAPAADGEGQEPGTWVVLSVRDNGKGIRQEEQKAVFDPYTSYSGGFGLGLWMVREIVTSIQARLQLTSVPGEGSCFEVFFPAATVDGESATAEADTETATPAAAAAPPTVAATAGQVILIIEDDPLVMTSLGYWLEASGYHVLKADNGDLALELFEANGSRLAAVIQDFLIPGRRGELLLQDFHALRPQLPVIVISAFPENRDFAWIRDHGAHAVLPKPFEIPELLGLLRRAIAGTPSSA